MTTSLTIWPPPRQWVVLFGGELDEAAMATAVDPALKRQAFQRREDIEAAGRPVRLRANVPNPLTPLGVGRSMDMHAHPFDAATRQGE